MKAMKSTKKSTKKGSAGQPAKKTMKRPAAAESWVAPAVDLDILQEPYSSFVREMWNSRGRLRWIMHPDQFPL